MNESVLHLRIRKSVMILFAICSTFLMAACGGVDGTYYMKMGEGQGEGVTLELLGGGKAVVTIGGMGGTEGTYTKEDGKVIVLLPNERDVYTIENGNLVTTMMGDKAVFVKQ